MSKHTQRENLPGRDRRGTPMNTIWDWDPGRMNRVLLTWR